MRSVQYVFDCNIVRVWKDEILIADICSKDSINAGTSLKQLNNQLNRNEDWNEYN